MLKEADVMRLVQLEASKQGCRLWRNNIGVLQAKDGRYIHYGIANPGGSDLIGYIPVTITEDMVGKTLAIFAGIEIKTKKGKPTPDQINFISHIMLNNGIAGIAKSPEQFKEIVDSYKKKLLP